MNRMLVVGFAVVLFGGVAWVQSAQNAKLDAEKEKSAAQAKAAPVAKPDAAKPASLAAKLASRVSFNGFDDPKMTFQDALDFLSSQFDMRSDVQENAFKAAGYQDKSVLSEPIATTPIPKMKDVTLDTVIRKILARVQSIPGKEATYMIQGDAILITTADVLVNQVWGNHRGP